MWLFDEAEQAADVLSRAEQIGTLASCDSTLLHVREVSVRRRGSRARFHADRWQELLGLRVGGRLVRRVLYGVPLSGRPIWSGSSKSDGKCRTGWPGAPNMSLWRGVSSTFRGSCMRPDFQIRLATQYL
jgi:hypothetical protein